jgi:hypothetical protein
MEMKSRMPIFCWVGRWSFWIAGTGMVLLVPYAAAWNKQATRQMSGGGNPNPVNWRAQ